jgi:hypothetical protein
MSSNKLPAQPRSNNNCLSSGCVNAQSGVDGI